MMTSPNIIFSASLTLCAGNSPVIGVLSDAGGENDGSSAIFERSLFPSQRASDAEFDVSSMWVSISCQRNIRMTGDLRLHEVHVTLS